MDWSLRAVFYYVKKMTLLTVKWKKIRASKKCPIFKRVCAFSQTAFSATFEVWYTTLVEAKELLYVSLNRLWRIL